MEKTATSFTLRKDVIEALDAKAKKEIRSRTSMLEVILIKHFNL